MTDKEHNVTVCLVFFAKAPLFNHLRVIHKAHKLPLSKIDDSLGYILSQVNDCNLSVHRSESLVGKKWIVYDPGLRNWHLWIVQHVFFIILFWPCLMRCQLCSDHIQTNFVCAHFFVDHGAIIAIFRCDERLIYIPQLNFFLLLSPQERLVKVEVGIHSGMRLPYLWNFIARLLRLSFFKGFANIVKRYACWCYTLSIAFFASIVYGVEFSRNITDIFSDSFSIDISYIFLKDEEAKISLIHSINCIEFINIVFFTILISYLHSLEVHFYFFGDKVFTIWSI